MSGLSLLSMHFKAMQIIVMLWTVSSYCYSCHMLNVSRYMQYIVSFHCCEIFWKAVSVRRRLMTWHAYCVVCSLSQSHWSGFFVRITYMGQKYIYIYIFILILLFIQMIHCWPVCVHVYYHPHATSIIVLVVSFSSMCWISLVNLWCSHLRVERSLTHSFMLSEQPLPAAAVQCKWMHCKGSWWGYFWLTFCSPCFLWLFFFSLWEISKLPIMSALLWKRHGLELTFDYHEFVFIESFYTASK